jgi:Sulfotransferase domain
LRTENRARLGPHDFVLAAHPGSGSSWIGTLLVELGLFYASGHEERLLDATSQRSEPWVEEGTAPAVGLVRPRLARAERARHLPSLHERDARHPSFREPVRVVLSNDSALGWKCERPVVLLVRDGRDALLSLYQHLVGFSGLQASFAEYLAGGGGAWPPPAHSWAVANLSWLDATPPERLLVLTFEGCRAEPLARFRELTSFLGTPRSDAELERAIAASSYDSMRRAEERALGPEAEAGSAPRFMRRGRIGEWREVYDAALLGRFAGLPRRALERFGYPTAEIP